MKNWPYCLRTTLFMTCLFLLPAAWADIGTNANPKSGVEQHSISDWQKVLESAEKELESPDITDDRLLEMRDQMFDIEKYLRQSRNEANDKAELIRHDLTTIGPAPKPEELPEAPTLTERRKHLNQEIAAQEGISKEADLLTIKVERNIETIKDIRRSRFTERVFTRSQSPLNPNVWAKAVPEWQSLYTRAMESLSEDFKPDGTDTLLSKDLEERLIAGLCIALLLAFPLRLGLTNHLARTQPDPPLSDLQRLRIATYNGLLNAMIPAMAFTAFYWSLTIGHEISHPVATLAFHTFSMTILVSITIGFSHAALRPGEPELRIFNLSDSGASSIFHVTWRLAGLFAIDSILSLYLDQQDVSVEVIATEKLVFSLLVSLILTSLMRRKVWTTAPDKQLNRGRQRVRLICLLLICLITVASIIGYLSISHILAANGVITLALLAVLTLLNKFGHQLALQLVKRETPAGAYLRDQLQLSSEGAEMLGFWLNLIIQSIIGLGGLVSLLMIWSIDRKDMLIWIFQIFEGFKIGNITLSLSGILTGLLLFTSLLTITRVIQRLLERQVFPRIRIDSGIKHSIRSSVGYAGFLLAGIAGFSSMGIDLSSLAFIAGALSLGIGFGLQNIVNNFISGLILLFERPIKVGDRIAIGEHQGHVKKISVRATEITTSDQASVFIPNSNLIAGAVINRTYANRTGCVTLPIGIAYDSDIKLARKLLLDIATANANVQKAPAPAVLMTGFGDSAIQLELIAFVHDVDKVRHVTSELGFAIIDTFREHRVEIPFPQRELRISTASQKLRDALA